MTTLILIIFVVLIAALVAVVMVRPRGRRAPRLRDEPLGNPHATTPDPVVRTESRHRDTPAGSDLDQHGGRHDG